MTLTVTDSGQQPDYPADSVTIIVDATAPTADAGDAQTVAAGTQVTLDGSGSSDGEGAVDLQLGTDRQQSRRHGDPDVIRHGGDADLYRPQHSGHPDV